MASLIAQDFSAAFDETVALYGVSITYNGVTKKGLTSAIERSRRQDTSGYLPEAISSVMLRQSDFDAFGELEDRKSVLTIDGVDLIYLSAKNHPALPFVYLTLTKDQ